MTLVSSAPISEVGLLSHVGRRRYPSISTPRQKPYIPVERSCKDRRLDRRQWIHRFESRFWKLLEYNSETGSENLRVVVRNFCKSRYSHRLSYFFWEVECRHVLVNGFEVKFHGRSNLKYGCIIEIVEIAWFQRC